MSENRSDATHPATPVQLEQATRKGDRTFSVELGTAVQLIGGLVAMLLCLQALGQWTQHWTVELWSGQPLSPAGVPDQLRKLAGTLASQLAPILLLLAAFAIVGKWLQTGIDFQPERVRPSLSRLVRVRSKDRPFPLRLLGGLLAFPKALLALGLGATLIWIRRTAFFDLAVLPPERLVVEGIGLVIGISFQVALVLLAAGMLDYGIAWQARRQRLQMSEQEIRDETRLQEGDPAVARRREEIRNRLSRANDPSSG